MSTNEADYKRLVKSLETAKRQQAEAAGAVSQIDHTLREDFDCETIQDAKKLLADLEAEQEQLEAEFTKELRAFEREFQDMLCPPSTTTDD